MKVRLQRDAKTKVTKERVCVQRMASASARVEFLWFKGQELPKLAMKALNFFLNMAFNPNPHICKRSGPSSQRLHPYLNGNGIYSVPPWTASRNQSAQANFKMNEVWAYREHALELIKLLLNQLFA